jgi:hypothetical protein
MNIPFSLALGIQDWLRVFTYDCYVADALTSGLSQGASHKERWQLAVDTTYRLLMSGLLESSLGESDDDAVVREKYFNYAVLLSKSDPFTSDVKLIAPWHEWDLCGTKLCKDLIEKHGVINLELGSISDGFINDIELLFEKNNVPWSNFPLIPINY